MAHTISYDSETGLIESKVHGTVDFKEIKEMYTKAATLFREKEVCRYLADYREARLSLSALDIYELPKTMAALASAFGLEAYKLKRAVVAANDLKDFAFYETVMANNGQNAKIFQDADEAKKWLLS